MSDQKSLRELVSISTSIETALIENGGELTPEIEAALAVKDMQLPEKVDGYSLVMDRMASVADFYAQKAELFLRLSKAAESVIEKCKDNLKFAMTELKVDELQGHDFKFKLQNSAPAVIIEDESKISESYKVIKTTIDKKKIGEDLKLGVPVEGARLERGQYVRQYANNKAAK